MWLSIGRDHCQRRLSYRVLLIALLGLKLASPPRLRNISSVILIAWLCYKYWAENRRTDKLVTEGALKIPEIDDIECGALTVKENVKF